jgi:hypothetical protein
MYLVVNVFETLVYSIIVHISLKRRHCVLARGISYFSFPTKCVTPESLCFAIGVEGL